MIREIDLLLIDWVNARERLERTALGYNGRSVLARVGEGRSDTPGRSAVVPEFKLGGRAAVLDHALSAAPEALRKAVIAQYGADGGRQGRERAWMQETGKGARSLYQCLDSAHCWVDGYLTARRGG